MIGIARSFSAGILSISSLMLSSVCGIISSNYAVFCCVNLRHTTIIDDMKAVLFNAITFAVLSV